MRGASRRGEIYRSGYSTLGTLLVGAVVVGTTTAAAGCSGLPSVANPDQPLWKNNAGWALSVDYTRDLVADSRKVGEPYERGEPEVDAAHSRVFVGSSDGGLYCVHMRSGETLWRFQTLSFVQSAPLYDGSEDALYFGSHDGALYKVNATTGALLWRLSTNAEVARRPVLADGRLLVANANDTLLSVDRATGEILWSAHRTPAAGMEVAGYSGPAVHEDLVYMGFSDGMAMAFDVESGRERWQPVDLAAEAEEAQADAPRYLDVDTTPVVTRIGGEAVAIFGSFEGGVFALEAALGTQVWANTGARGVSDLHLWEQPEYRRNGEYHAARRLLLVSTGGQGLLALDVETGDEVWRRELPKGGVSRPVEIAGALLFSSSKLGLYLVSPVDGSLIDGIHLDPGISATPAASGRRAFVLTNGGTLLGLSVHPPSPAAPPPGPPTY